MKNLFAFNLALIACLAINSIGVAQKTAPHEKFPDDVENTSELFPDNQASASDLAVSPSSNGEQESVASGECTYWAESELNFRPVNCVQHAVPCFPCAPVATQGACCATDPFVGIGSGYDCQTLDFQTIHLATNSHPCGRDQVVVVTFEESLSNCEPFSSTTGNFDSKSGGLVRVNGNPIPACSCKPSSSGINIQGAYPPNGCVETTRQTGHRSRFRREGRRRLSR